MKKKEYIEPACQVMLLKPSGSLLIASLVVDPTEVDTGYADGRLDDITFDWE